MGKCIKRRRVGVFNRESDDLSTDYRKNVRYISGLQLCHTDEACHSTGDHAMLINGKCHQRVRDTNRMNLRLDDVSRLVLLFTTDG